MVSSLPTSTNNMNVKVVTILIIMMKSYSVYLNNKTYQTTILNLNTKNKNTCLNYEYFFYNMSIYIYLSTVIQLFHYFNQIVEFGKVNQLLPFLFWCKLIHFIFILDFVDQLILKIKVLPFFTLFYFINLDLRTNISMSSESIIN